MKAGFITCSIWLIAVIVTTSNVHAANGAFQIYNGAVSLPDGSVLTTAPKDGKSLLNGIGAPSVVANIGDFYIDTTNNRLYGPYVGSWGTGVSLVGSQGLQGAKGDTGTTGSTGQVTLATMCSAITAGGAQLPSYCPGYAPTYSLGDLKGTWKWQSLGTLFDTSGKFYDSVWTRMTMTITASGGATGISYYDSEKYSGTIPSTTFSITPDGTVTFAANAAFSGNMSMDKNLIIFTYDPSGTGRAIGALVKIAQ